MASSGGGSQLPVQHRQLVTRCTNLYPFTSQREFEAAVVREVGTRLWSWVSISACIERDSVELHDGSA